MRRLFGCISRQVGMYVISFRYGVLISPDIGYQYSNSLILTNMAVECEFICKLMMSGSREGIVCVCV